MQHVLITNDFPPKIGGIQSYLFELWRRQPQDSFAVLTSSSHKGAIGFDAAQDFKIARGPAVLLPTNAMRKRANSFISASGAKFAVIDPAVPLGMIGPSLDVPYAVVLHGAEVTVPARLPLLRNRLGKVLRNACHIISAGEYAANEARRLVGNDLPPLSVIPPGVDVERFHPITDKERADVRTHWKIPQDAFVVVGHSRLVPRKGFDTFIKAIAQVNADLHDGNVIGIIVGAGRDRKRLDRLAQTTAANVRFLGRVNDDELAPLVAASDVSAMLCRSRWAGLEQEGFGIVFVESAACGIPQIAGRSGGAFEAVAEGVTGYVIDNPKDYRSVASHLQRIRDEPSLRMEFSEASRLRAVATFSYDVLSDHLRETLEKIAHSV